MSRKNRICDYISRLFDLYYERTTAMQDLNRLSAAQSNDITNKINGINATYNRISNIQLQMKHILLEIESIKHYKLNPAQNRLIADSYSELLFPTLANRYWQNAIKGNDLCPALKSEYLRYYGAFLYSINDVSNAALNFEKSVSLKETCDGDKFIICKSFDCWIESIMGNIRMYTHSNSQRDDLKLTAEGALKRMKSTSSTISKKHMRHEAYRDCQRLEQLINKEFKNAS